MMTRTISATFAALLVAGMVSSPVEAFAKGGLGGGFKGFRGTFHRPFVRIPHVAPRAAFFGPRIGRVPGALPALRHHGFAHHHRRGNFYGLPVAVGGGVAVYGSYYDPADIVGSTDQPAVDPTYDGPAYTGGYRGSCYSKAYTVPSEDGGERTITVTRC